MKQFSYILCLLSFAGALGQKAQAQTAMDFNRPDCNSVNRHLFADLDAGNVVILEFFMNSCSPCINAGDNLEAMKTDLLTDFPGKITSYATPYNNSTTCTTALNWVTTNGFTSIPMDSGAVQVAYYGGFGMPTVVVLAGSDHRVMNTFVGWSASDTNAIADSIRAFLSGTTGISEASEFTSLSVSPNPADVAFEIRGDVKVPTSITWELLTIEGKSVELSGPITVDGVWSREIDVSSMASGIYVLRVRSPQGEITRKISVHH